MKVICWVTNTKTHTCTEFNDGKLYFSSGVLETKKICVH